MNIFIKGMKVIADIKAYIQSNARFPHPTLVAVAIGAAISAITVSVFYMAETGLFGQDVAEATHLGRWGRGKPR